MSNVLRGRSIAVMVALGALFALAVAPVALAGISTTASLTIVKETIPGDDPQDFDFDITSPGGAIDLDLDTHDDDATLSAQQSYIVTQGGTWTITESAIAGWTLTNVVCTGDTEWSLLTGVATVQIDNGESVICTFTNTKHASLTVVKETDPASDPQDFDWDLTGSGLPSDLDMDTDAGNATLPSSQSFNLNWAQFGAHTVVESAVAGWDLTALICTGAGDDSSTNLGTRTATLDIDPGENIVCTFTNTKHASLTVVKTTSPASDPQDFDFDLTGSGVPADLDLDTDAGDATLPSQQTFNLSSSQLGAHSVTESFIPGWVLTNLQCPGAGADSSTTLGDRVATLDIDAGENVICTFTNTKAGATITVVKVTDPASDPQDFDFDLTGAAAPTDIDLDTDAGSPSLASQQTFDVSAEVPSLYTIAESLVTGWTLTNLVCTGGGEDSSTSVETRTATINLDGGEHVVCTFTNTKHTQLTITKVTDPAEHPQDFYFDLVGLFNTALDTDSGDATNSNTDTVSLPPSSQGQQNLIEDAYPGWTVTNIVCTGDDSWGTELAQRRAQLTLDPGENISCTFTNTFVGLGSDPPVTDPPATDPPATDPPASPDPSDDNAGETDTPTQPGSDTAARESAAATGNNVLLLVLALGVLGGILLITRPKKGPR